MRNTKLISLAIAAMLLIGCDGSDVFEWAAPKVRVSFVNGLPPAPAGKSSAVLQVELQIRSSGGRDYSPEPVTVDNNATRQVAFDVSIPADSQYVFLVRFTQSGRLIGEGATVEKVTLETTVVDIAVLQTSSGTPSIAFVPSAVNTSTGSGNIELRIRFYGDSPTAGVAALFNIVGPTPRPLTFEGADLAIVDGREVSTAWQFPESIQGEQDIGTLTISRSQAADFCLEAGTNDVRVVDRDGLVSVAALLGTCITVSP